jgi:hypothetical protein
LPRRPRKRTGPACTICRHEHRALIESSRLAGASLDSVAAKYSVSRDSIHRHMKSHVSDDLRAELLAAVPLEQLAAEAAREGLTVLQYLSLTRATLVRQMQLASSVNDHHATATVARALNETNRLIAGITGELSTIAARNNINITNVAVLQEHPEFARVQATLLRALEKHPEARADVVAALRSLDAETSPAATPRPANPDMKLLELEAAHVGHR